MRKIEEIVIRMCFPEEIPQIVDLWYDVSVRAHDFVPPEFWKTNKARMASEFLPAAENLVALDGERIVGFISLASDYLAGLFVLNSMQGKGVGSLLLNEGKKRRNKLSLKVYRKNKKSIKFYQNQGFHIESEELDQDTGEKELLMIWDTSQQDFGEGAN